MANLLVLIKQNIGRKEIAFKLERTPHAILCKQRQIALKAYDNKNLNFDEVLKCSGLTDEEFEKIPRRLLEQMENSETLAEPPGRLALRGEPSLTKPYSSRGEEDVPAYVHSEDDYQPTPPRVNTIPFAEKSRSAPEENVCTSGDDEGNVSSGRPSAEKPDEEIVLAVFVDSMDTHFLANPQGGFHEESRQDNSPCEVSRHWQSQSPSGVGPEKPQINQN
jgi:hypothetical protein